MHPLKTFLLLLLCFPAAAQTLSSPSFQLHEGSLVPAASPVLENPSATLRLGRGTLGQLAAGASSSASGIQLTGGVVPVPEPHYGLLVGLGLLFHLKRRSARSKR